MHFKPPSPHQNQHCQVFVVKFYCIYSPVEKCYYMPFTNCSFQKSSSFVTQVLLIINTVSESCLIEMYRL